MKIGVISDTHVPISSPRLSKALLEGLKDCQMIIHAGDLVEASVLEVLNEICPVKAVLGNMDGPDLQGVLPNRLFFDVDGIKIGVLHGWGSSKHIEKKVLQVFDPLPDIIIFGHSHKPIIKKTCGVILFNPGSAADRFLGNNCTYGLIEIRGGQIFPQINECS